MTRAVDNDSTSVDDWLLWIDAIAFVMRWLRTESAAEDFIIQELSEGRITYQFGYTCDFDYEVSEPPLPLTVASVEHWFWRWPHSKDFDLKIDRDRSSAVRHGPVLEAGDYDTDLKPHSLRFDPRRSMTLRATWIRLRRSRLVWCLRNAGFMPWPSSASPEQQQVEQPAPEPATAPAPAPAPATESEAEPTEPVVGSLTVTDTTSTTGGVLASADAAHPKPKEVLDSLRPGTAQYWVLHKMIESPTQIWDHDLAEKLAELCPVEGTTRKTIQTCLGKFRKLFGTRP